MLKFMLAGHDTTAFSISWILLCLAKHPEEQTKLRESLNQYDTPEEWIHSEQLQFIIKEGMRMYPVARSGKLMINLWRLDNYVYVDINELVSPSILASEYNYQFG